MRLLGWLLAAVLVPGTLAGQSAQATDEIVEIAVSLSGDEANLDIELTDGRSVQIRLIDGHIYVGGDQVGSYEPGGEFEMAWRDLLRRASEGEFGEAWAPFLAAEYGSDAGALETMRAAIEASLAIVPATVAAAIPAAEDMAVEETIEAAIEAAMQGAAVAIQESVEGGLVVKLHEMEGLARSLGRIGLTSELSHELNGALVPPMRIVLEADEYLLPEGALVDESLWLVETDGMVAGTITGNLFVADGSLIIAPSAVIEGDVITLDATIENLGGTIVGEIRDLEAAISPIMVAPRPIRIIDTGSRGPAFLSNIGRGVGTIMQTFAVFLIFGLIGAVAVYFFRNNLEAVSDTVSYSFGRSFFTGLAAQILFLPVLLVLAVLVLTWIVIPVYVVGSILAVVLGYLAVAHAAGENLTRKRYASWAARMRRSNSYYYVLSGLAVLLGFFAVAGVAEMGGALLAWAYGLLIATAWILSWVASTAGLGASLLSRGGTRRSYARPRQVPELPVQLPADSLEAEMETIQRRARASRRRRAREANDEI
jgi:hypothetical protein